MHHLTKRREAAAFVSRPSGISALILFFHKSRLFVIQFYILLPPPLNRMSCIFPVIKVLCKYESPGPLNMLAMAALPWTWLLLCFSVSHVFFSRAPCPSFGWGQTLLRLCGLLQIAITQSFSRSLFYVVGFH